MGACNSVPATSVAAAERFTSPVVTQDMMSLVVPSSLLWSQLTCGDSKNSDNSLVLGEGGFGKVVRAVLDNNTIVAVKIIIPKSSSGPSFDNDFAKLREQVFNEVKILKEIESKLPLGGEYMIQIVDWVEGELPQSFHGTFSKKRAVGVVMRLEAGGTLTNYLRVPRGLRLIDRVHIVLQLARIVAELHEIGVTHGDIKPDNVFLTHHSPPLVRIADFGQSIYSTNNNKSSVNVSPMKSKMSKMGSPLYSAPELLLLDAQTGSRGKATKRSDIYSLALIAYETLCSGQGHQPVNILLQDIIYEQQIIKTVVKMVGGGKDGIESVAKLGKRPPLSALCSDTPATIVKLIENGWDKERSLRPSALEFYSKTEQSFYVLTMSGSSDYDIFISHAWVNKTVLRYVKKYFTNASYKVWFDEETNQWDLKRSVDGISKSKVILACINSAYESNRNCMVELKEASRLANKHIVTLSTDFNPFSWIGKDTQYGELKQLCDLQGKICFDIGNICARPEWGNETDESPIPKELVDELNMKLSDLVKYLRGSQINCNPSVSVCDNEAENKKQASLSITNAAESLSYLAQFGNFNAPVLGGEALVVSHLASIIALQKGSKSFNEELINLGICDKLLCLFRSPLSEGILTKVFSIVNYLCRSDGISDSTSIESHQTKLNSSGIVEQILSNLTVYMNSPSITMSACVALRSINYNNNDAQVKLASLGLLDIMLKLINLYEDKPLVMEKISMALCNVSSNAGNQVKLGSLGFCEVLSKILIRQQENAVIMEHMCGTIRNMSLNDENQIKLAETGVCDALSRLLIRHFECAPVMEHVCSAIWNMSLNDENACKFAESGVCEALVRVFTRLEDNADVMQFACGAIRFMSLNAEVRSKFKSLGYVNMLNKVLTLHKDIVKVQTQATGALKRLS